MNEQPKQQQHKRRRWGEIATIVFTNGEHPLFVNRGEEIRYVADQQRFAVIKKDRTVYFIPAGSVAYVRLEPQSEEKVAEEGQENAEQPS